MGSYLKVFGIAQHMKYDKFNAARKTVKTLCSVVS
jgi:hypothetical protein